MIAWLTVKTFFKNGHTFHNPLFKPSGGSFDTSSQIVETGCVMFPASPLPKSSHPTGWGTGNTNMQVLKGLLVPDANNEWVSPLLLNPGVS